MAESTRTGRLRERYRRALRSGYTWVSPRRWLRRLVFWGGAIAVGFAATVFAILGFYADEAFHDAIATNRWLSLAILPAGVALIAFVTQRLFPGSQGSGIPQTIAALQLDDGPARGKLLSMRIAMGKMLLTTLGLLSGASVGREGPTVQIGASIMHSLGRFARFPSHEISRGLILAGAAAGVAAAFNTPLAGIVFAIEELSRSFEHRTTGTVITAVIFAGVTSLAVLGNYTYFGETTAALSIEQGWLAILVCGAAGGLLGGAFARMLLAMSAGLPGRIGRWIGDRPVAFAAACGMVLALIGIASGDTTYGTGYQQAKLLLEGSSDVPQSFGILKLLATLVSFVSGIPGGIFAPSLAIGAGLGANLAHILPDTPAGALVLLGVVAYFTGVVQAPLTAFIIVMEMTANHGMVFPLMATALIAQGASRLVCKEPLYKGLAEGFLKRTTGSVGSHPSDARNRDARNHAE
ncbi:MAG: chloride channel protein [Sterolibacteriaceae bacterium]|uniref:Chloride channel protein n=1 Tax=Candidatus Methylophosphatis roskildensis TaxID=2899263 RepID=A0A9D7E8J6_9PROT|nr:chloride channel protein [Candidatus Methylophosphatis roskildensis]MBK7235993.1 chloride channel protein [Sterolibacteriaceae bacterium]